MYKTSHKHSCARDKNISIYKLINKFYKRYILYFKYKIYAKKTKENTQIIKKRI